MEPFTTALILLVASFVITGLIAKKPKPQAPSTLAEFSVPTVDEGTPQIVVFGDVWISDATILWYGDYSTKAIKGKGKK